jgi:hypothetical protein
MGEYAIYNNQSVKIGTCEDMYYLRHDQRHKVEPEEGSVDPVKHAASLRFRFPWPDEDGTAPGSFPPAYREVAIPDSFDAPTTGYDHYRVHFNEGVIQVSIPCPLDGLTSATSRPEHEYTREYIHHGETKRATVVIRLRGDHPRAYLVAQRLRGNVLVPVLMCGGCRAMYRIEDPAQIEALACAFRAQADEDQKYKRSTIYASHGHVISNRILAGANLTPQD